MIFRVAKVKTHEKSRKSKIFHDFSWLCLVDKRQEICWFDNGVCCFDNKICSFDNTICCFDRSDCQRNRSYCQINRPHCQISRFLVDQAQPRKIMKKTWKIHEFSWFYRNNHEKSWKNHERSWFFHDCFGGQGEKSWKIMKNLWWGKLTIWQQILLSKWQILLSKQQIILFKQLTDPIVKKTEHDFFMLFCSGLKNGTKRSAMYKGFFVAKKKHLFGTNGKIMFGTKNHVFSWFFWPFDVSQNFGKFSK